MICILLSNEIRNNFSKWKHWRTCQTRFVSLTISVSSRYCQRHEIQLSWFQRNTRRFLCWQTCSVHEWNTIHTTVFHACFCRETNLVCSSDWHVHCHLIYVIGSRETQWQEHLQTFEMLLLLCILHNNPRELEMKRYHFNWTVPNWPNVSFVMDSKCFSNVCIFFTKIDISFVHIWQEHENVFFSFIWMKRFLNCLKKQKKAVSLLNWFTSWVVRPLRLTHVWLSLT